MVVDDDVGTILNSSASFFITTGSTTSAFCASVEFLHPVITITVAPIFSIEGIKFIISSVSPLFDNINTMS